MAKFSFNEIELGCECDPDPQACDLVSIFECIVTLVSLPNLDQFSELTFTYVPINLEIESPILDSHISLLGKECESPFFDLDPIIEPIPTLEPKDDFLSSYWFPNFSFKRPNHPFYKIILYYQGIDHNDSVMIF